MKSPGSRRRHGGREILAANRILLLHGAALSLLILAALPMAAHQPRSAEECVAVPAVSRNVPPAALPKWPEADVVSGPASVAQARETFALPPPKPCGGRCQVDIAFVYSPEIIGQHDTPGWPQSAAQLRSLLRNVTREVSAIWLRSGVDAELRFVGMEADAALNGLTVREAIELEGYGRLRTKYGADLVYASPSGPGYHGVGWLGFAGGLPGGRLFARDGDLVDGALKDGSLWSPFVLGHQIGHNLWLVHDPKTRGRRPNDAAPIFAAGQGYIGSFPPAKLVVADSAVKWYEQNGYTCAGHPGPWDLCTRGESRELGTLMTYGPRIAGQPLSSPALRHAGLPLGEHGVHDALSVARRIMPYLASVRPPSSSKDPNPYDCAGPDSRCLDNGRFKIRSLYGHPVNGWTYASPSNAFLSDAGVVFSFFDVDNPELLLKVVDGCGVNGHYWVFGSAATDLDYQVVVEDLSSEETVTYQSAGGVISNGERYSTGAGVISDTSAFPCGTSTSAHAAVPSRTVAIDPGGVPAGGSSASQPSFGSDAYYGCGYNCVGGGRFSLSAYFHRSSFVAARRSRNFLSDTGAIFTFFDPANPELLLKVVDGCGVNGHYWVFGSAATDLEYRVNVTDYAAVSRRSYQSHGYGRITSDHGYVTTAGVISDTTAFACNP